MQAWLKPFFFWRKDPPLIPTSEWMHRARISLMAHCATTTLAGIEIRTSGNEGRIALYLPDGRVQSFTCPLSEAPEKFVREKVGTWIIRQLQS